MNAESLSHDQLFQAFHFGRSRLKEPFQAQIGTGVFEYFKTLKIEQAKSLIREQQYNFTEVTHYLAMEAFIISQGIQEIDRYDTF